MCFRRANPVKRLQRPSSPSSLNAAQLSAGAMFFTRGHQSSVYQSTAANPAATSVLQQFLLASASRHPSPLTGTEINSFFAPKIKKVSPLPTSRPLLCGLQLLFVKTLCLLEAAPRLPCDPGTALIICCGANRLKINEFSENILKGNYRRSACIVSLRHCLSVPPSKPRPAPRVLTAAV